jgi:ribosomal protein S18 acetylase RimI-like enzyme
MSSLSSGDFAFGEQRMNNSQAEQIADLLNRQNQLTKRQTGADILERSDQFLVELDDSGRVIAVVEVERVQWYQAEIRHLSVEAGLQGRGYGRRMLLAAERRAIELGVRIAQCTIRDDNTASIKLFLTSGYVHNVTFVNAQSGNRVMVLQKVLQ